MVTVTSAILPPTEQFCSTILAVAVVAARIVGRQGKGTRELWTRALTVLVVALAMLGAWVARCPDWDETEHLHAAWRMSQGDLPYRDFWEHHSPALWIMLSPVLGRFPHSAWVCDFSRLVSLAMGLAAWALALALARRLHGRSRGLTIVMAILWAGAIFPGEFYNLRPDLVAGMLTVGAILTLAAGRTPPRVLAGGALMGLAVAFSPKHIPLLAALPLTAALEGRLLPALKSIALHTAGAVVGFLPLVAWLAAKGLVSDYVFWVYSFNTGEPVVLGGTYPLILAALFAAWAARTRVDRWHDPRPEERLVFMAVVLSASILFFYKAGGKFLYHLQVFMPLAAAAGAADGAAALRRLVSNGYAWAAGALVGLYLLGSAQGWQWISSGDYIKGRAEIGSLIRAADGGTVVTVTPLHPIFARDATDISQAWQWASYLMMDPVRERLGGLVDRIVRARPMVVMAESPQSQTGPQSSPDRNPLVSFTYRLARSGVVTEPEAVRLQDFLQANYSLVRLPRHTYWIRNDRCEPRRQHR